MFNFIKRLFIKKNDTPLCFGEYLSGNIHAERCCDDCWLLDHCFNTSTFIKTKQSEVKDMIIKDRLRGLEK